MKILYHGSNVPITKIDFRFCRKGRDFGRGFYLSENKLQAERMAINTTERRGEGSPIVTSFCFDDEAAFCLSLKRFEGYDTEWAKFISLNRMNRTNKPAHSYDIVYGPIANDKVGVQVQLFKDDLISVEVLMKRLQFITPTFQFCFCTERSLEFLTLKG